MDEELIARYKNAATKMAIGMHAANKHGAHMMIDCGDAQSSAFAIGSLICYLAFASEKPLEKVVEAVDAAAKMINEYNIDTGVYGGAKNAAH